MSGKDLGPEEVGSAESASGAPAWMATFADMMTLLLCFFVLLLSFANVDIVKFRDMLGSLDEAFGVSRTDPGPYTARATTPIELETRARLEPAEPELAPTQSSERNREFVASMSEVAEQSELGGVVEAVAGAGGLTLRIEGAFVFESGSDNIRLGAMALLDEIAALAARSDYHVSVEGHTDDVPIHSARFPTNWHLSAARAVAGVIYLTGPGKLDPARVSATGYAHTRPIAWGQSEAARRENRRLEIVFQAPDDTP